jgi:hypothetical protein
LDQNGKKNIDDFSLELVFDYPCDKLEHPKDAVQDRNEVSKEGDDHIVKLIFRDPFGKIASYETETDNPDQKVTKQAIFIPKCTNQVAESECT